MIEFKNLTEYTSRSEGVVFEVSLGGGWYFHIVPLIMGTFKLCLGNVREWGCYTDGW